MSCVNLFSIVAPARATHLAVTLLRGTLQTKFSSSRVLGDGASQPSKIHMEKASHHSIADRPWWHICREEMKGFLFRKAELYVSDKRHSKLDEV